MLNNELYRIAFRKKVYVQSTNCGPIWMRGRIKDAGALDPPIRTLLDAVPMTKKENNRRLTQSDP